MRVSAIIAIILFVLALIVAVAALLGAGLPQVELIILGFVAAGLAVRELPG